MRRILLLASLGILATASAADARGLSAPALVSPANNARTQQLPAITWNAVRGAAQYEYQVASDRHFSSIVLGSGPGKGTSHTHNLAAALEKDLPDGTYYWRVRALTAKDKVGPWSKVRLIVKRWTIAPAPTGGNNVAINWPTTPLVLRWTSVPYATKYIVTVATDPTLSNVVLGSASKPVQTQGVNFALPSSLAPGAYFWAVTPVDAEGHRGTRSDVATFQWSWPTSTATHLTNLSPDARVFDPMFSWDPVPGAARYEVEVNSAEGFPPGSKWCCTGSTTGTSLAPLKALANNRYYWRVRAFDAKGDAGTWNYGERFTKAFDSLSPTIPDLSLRAPNGVTLSGVPGTDTPIVTWSPVPGASHYEVQTVPYETGLGCDWSLVASDPSVYQAETATTAWTPLGLAGRLGPTAWPRPQTSLPLESGVPFAATTTSGSPVLSKAEYVPGSHPEVGSVVIGPGIPENTTIESILGGTVTMSNSATATAGSVELTASPRYCLRVLARSDDDAQGRQVISDWTQLNGPGEPAFVYTPPPSLGELQSPFSTPLGAYLEPLPSGISTGRTPWFAWKPVEGAQGYYVVVARDAGFTEVVDVGYTNVPAYAPRLANQAPFSDETTAYYWAAIPTIGPNGSGAFHDLPQENHPQEFNKNSVSPAPLAPGSEVFDQPTFRWSGAENARNYHLQVSQDPTFGKPIDDVTTDATAYTSSSTYPADTVVYWRVRANDWNGQGLNWSPTRTFVRRLPAPTPTAHLGAGGIASVPLTWTAVQGAISYDVHIDQPDGKTTESSVEAPSGSINEWYGTGFGYWQVRAEFPTTSGGRVAGPFSSLQPILVTLPGPGGARGVKAGSRVVVSWNPDPEAKRYRVEISTSSGFGSKISSQTVDGTSSAPDIDLTKKQNRGVLYWRVAPVDQRGGVGSFVSGIVGASRSRSVACVPSGKGKKKPKHTAPCKKSSKPKKHSKKHG
jgi:hypothetical protein